MGVTERKQKGRVRFCKRLIITGIAAVFVLLILIALLILTGMEGLNLTGKGNIQTIEPFVIMIGIVALGTLLAVVLITVLLRISAEEYQYKFDQLSPEYQPDGSLSKPKSAELIEKAFADGYCRFEWMHQKLNGEPIPCEVTLARVKHNNDFALAAYVRDLRELKKIMKEAEQRERLLNTVNNVISVLLSINNEKSFEASLLKSFELVGNCLDVDRVQIWRNEAIDGELHFVHRYEWLSDCGRNNVPVPIGLHFPYSSKPEWENLFMRGEYINSPLSKLKENEQSFLNSYEIKSIVIIPMFLEGNFWGFFSIDDCRKERTFSDDEMHILASVGLMMSSAVNRNMQNAKINEVDERMRIMFNTMPLGAIIRYDNLNYFDCNESIVNMFGLSGEQEFSDKFNQLSPEYQPDGRLSSEEIDEFVEKALANGYCRFEWMHQKLNGEPIPCEVTLMRVKYYNELTLTAYVRDLRELKTSIKKIHESEQSLSILSNILNSIDAQVYVIVPHSGEILFVNDRMKNDFKVGDECIGKLCYKIFLKDIDGICDFCPCYKLDKEPDTTVVWEMYNPVTNRTYRNATRYIEWSDGRTVQIQHSFDVTELIEAKKIAERSNLSKNRFLSRVSHEVRTPMNAILGITEIQLENNTISPEMKEALNEIYNSGYLLLGIINDILDLSKIEAGKLELLPSVYDIPSFINDTVHLNIIQYENKPINFNLYVDENVPSMLFGDELRIKQILNNLLSNAFKYTEKGKVSLSIAAEYPRQGEEPHVTLVFLVADTGQGMTGEQLGKLFDEYTRFNTEANRTTQGTGLGMNITKHLVSLMGGEISVESEPGKGSIFTIRLPQGTVGAEALGKEMAENLMQFRVDRMGQMKNVPRIVREYMPYGRVLIVDDVETNLYVARGLIAPYGLSVETATSGFEAVDKIKSGATFDVIFMDHYMPKMDGIETVKIIRSLGYTRSIVALTANALTGQAEMFIENGFDGFISKPIDIRQLNATLNKLVRDKYPPEVVEAARQHALRINEKKQASDSELAVVFARDAEKAIANLKTIITNAFRRTDDFRQYVINVHSMKSALANIGEDALSAIALKLELAGRAQKKLVIESETPAFLEALSEIINRNRPKHNDGDTVKENSDNDRKYLAEKLLAIRTACEKYDEATANTALDELKNKEWSNSTKELLDTIAMHLLHSDFEEAAKLAENNAQPNIS